MGSIVPKFSFKSGEWASGRQVVSDVERGRLVLGGAASGGGGSGSNSLFNQVASGTLSSGTKHNLGVLQLSGYVSGTSNLLQATAASGGSTIGGVDMSAAPNGFVFVLRNPSTTDPLDLLHDDLSASYPFLLVNAEPATLPPLGAQQFLYISGTGIVAI